MQEKPTIGQISSFQRIINDDYAKHLDLSDSGEIYKKLSNMTYPQYKYLLSLNFRKQHIKAMEILQQLGIERITV